MTNRKPSCPTCGTRMQPAKTGLRLDRYNWPRCHKVWQRLSPHSIDDSYSWIEETQTQSTHLGGDSWTR